MDVQSRKQEVVERYGPWTGHCIHLADDVYTWDGAWPTPRLTRYLQVVADIVDRPLGSLRVLDLACLEGHFGIEFAKHGSTVVAIEGRPDNLERARFAKDVLGLGNLDLRLDDVRNLDPATHGYFDVVLCLGILYHLDVADIMRFLEQVTATCRRLLVIDTHFSAQPLTSIEWKGHTYWGKIGVEHAAGSTAAERLAKSWYSLDNVTSFQLTKASLCNALRRLGFTSIHECLEPFVPGESRDRITIVALKGRRHRVLSSPITEASPAVERPEVPISNEIRDLLRSALSRHPAIAAMRRVWRRSTFGKSGSR
jgi:SAM-dependent methyltransferase